MKRLVAVVVLAFLPLAAGAQQAPSLSARAAADITAYLQEAVKRGDIPGVVALVVTRDRVIYHEAFGAQAQNVPMSKDTVFNIASMTKPITSAAAMMLIEEGKLKLGDEAAKYAPEAGKLPVLSKVDVAGDAYETRPARRAMTIQHLLTNTSGIGYTFSDPGLALVQRKTKASDAELPLVHEPGERWTYGGSTRVLGDIIVKLTGQPLDRFFDDRIFKPLGMRDTFFAVPADKAARLAAVYNRTGGKWVEQPRNGIPPATIRGDGGLYSTAGDYAQFIRLILNDGSLNGTRLLAAGSVRDMSRNQIGGLFVPLQPTTNPNISNPFPLGAGKDKWGLGFQIAAGGDASMRSAGSLSWAGIFNTEFWIDPQKQVGAVLLMQVLPFYDERAIDILRGFERRVYRGLGE